jgi:hypothetical protein
MSEICTDEDAILDVGSGERKSSRGSEQGHLMSPLL